MRRVAAALAIVAAATGCGDDPIATVVIELAPEPLEESCNLSAGFEPADPEQIETLHFLLCPAGPVPCIERDPTSLVPVQPVEGPIAAADAGVAAPGIFVERNEAFDARLPGGMPLRFEVIACAGDEAIARGVVDGARVGEDDLRVRLYRHDAVSCAGPRVEGTLPFPRGFHAMTRLGNGDILVYGGVTGTEASAPGDGPAGIETWRGLALEQRVEVYRPSQERFLPVTVTEESGEPGGFRRVLFTSALLDAPANGPQRIRVYGGLTAAVGNAVLRFDHNQNRSALGAPILPHPAAEVASTVDLIYDPGARSLRIEAVAPGASVIPKHAASALAPPGEGLGVLALGLASDGETTLFAAASDPLLSASQLRWNAGMFGPANLPLPQATYVTIGSDGETSGDGMMMLAGRFGHTATAIDVVAPGATLVWGGNVYAMDDAARDALTGELVLPGGGTTAIEAGAVTGLPRSTAFHTATALSDSEVLRAGGRVVGCVTPLSGCATPISQMPAMPALAVLRRSGMSFVQDPVAGTAESTIFHAATPAYAHPDAADGAPLTTFVTGGAGAGLAPSGQIVQVTRGPTGFVAESPFTQVVGGMPRAARLGEARLGHAAAQLSPRRILVTGGLVVGGGTVEAIGTAEVIAWDAGAFWNPCPARPEAGGAPVFPDAGTDAGPLPRDAGFDAALPPRDSGIGGDSGSDSGL